MTTTMNSDNGVVGLLNVLLQARTSTSRDNWLFYDACWRFLGNTLNGSTAAFATVQLVLDAIVETERALFNRSLILNYLLNFLAANSDGDNLQCIVNVRLLDHLMTKYIG